MKWTGLATETDGHGAVPGLLGHAGSSVDVRYLSEVSTVASLLASRPRRKPFDHADSWWSATGQRSLAGQHVVMNLSHEAVTMRVGRV